MLQSVCEHVLVPIPDWDDVEFVSAGKAQTRILFETWGESQQDRQSYFIILGLYGGKS